MHIILVSSRNTKDRIGKKVKGKINQTRFKVKKNIRAQISKKEDVGRLGM